MLRRLRRRARSRTRASASAAGAAPSRSTTRLGAGEVDHRRRRAGQRPDVELGRAGLADPGRHVVERHAGRARRGRSRSSPATQPTASSTRRAAVGQLRHPHADRVGAGRRSASGKRRAGFGRTSVYGPGSSARTIIERLAQLGHAVEELVDARGEQRRRLLRSPPLQLVERASTRLAAGGARRARRRCRSAAAPGSPARSALDSRRVPIAPPRIRSRPARSRADADAVVAERPRAGPSTCARALRVHLEHEPARRARARASATSRSVCPSSTSAAARLPVAHLRLERRRSRRASTYGGFETTRSNGPSRPASRSVSTSSTVEPVGGGVLARERERVGRDVGRVDARVRELVLQRQRDRARAGADVERRAAPRRRRAVRGTARRRSRSPVAARARARRVFSVSRRKSQSPST